jgi:putative pre-16S rRNA nuclease
MPGTPETTSGTILALDYGLRRIGVACGQSVTGTASPAGVVTNTGDDRTFEAIARLIDEWRPSSLVVGLPLQADGSPGEMHARVEDFVRDLGRFGLPVATVDERYTSREAEAILKDARAAGTRGRVTREAIDGAAAVLIAERYLAKAHSGT